MCGSERFEFWRRSAIRGQPAARYYCLSPTERPARPELPRWRLIESSNLPSSFRKSSSVLNSAGERGAFFFPALVIRASSRLKFLPPPARQGKRIGSGRLRERIADCNGRAPMTGTLANKRSYDALRFRPRDRCLSPQHLVPNFFHRFEALPGFIRERHDRIAAGLVMQNEAVARQVDRLHVVDGVG